MKQSFKKTANGYTLTTRITMTLAQLDYLSHLSVGEELTVSINQERVMFLKDNTLVGVANDEIATEIIKHHHNFVSCTISGIKEKFGVFIEYTVSSLEVPLPVAKTIDTKSKQYKRHDIYHFSRWRFVVYSISLLLSLVAVVYAVIAKEIITIALMGFILLSSIYLVYDQIQFYRKERR